MQESTSEKTNSNQKFRAIVHKRVSYCIQYNTAETIHVHVSCPICSRGAWPMDIVDAAVTHIKGNKDKDSGLQGISQWVHPW